MIKLIKRIVLLTFVFCACSLYAWNDAGHMVVAEIAHRHLDPEVREEAERLIKVLQGHYPEQSSFITAATWADEVARNGLLSFSSWHYFTNIYDPESILSESDMVRIKAENHQNNVIWGIEQALYTLGNPKAKDFEKGLMIRFLLHLAGDIHQPMHNTTRFSDRFPEGDRGGNNYKLRGQIKNLHAFWDWGGGFLGDQSTVHALADQAMAAFTFEQAQGLIEQPVSAWSQESYFIAVSMAYQVEENSEPDQEYAEAVQQISKERLALAGYRLAHVLNILFKR